MQRVSGAGAAGAIRELLSVRGTYKKHDAGDETEPNTESQSASGAEEDGGQEG